jgi:hypothetical protein
MEWNERRSKAVAATSERSAIDRREWSRENRRAAPLPDWRFLMAGVEKRDFDSPDESRTPAKTRSDIVHLGGTTAARLTLEPGWRWSDCVKPVAGTETCQHRHVGVVQSGRMRVSHDDGTVLELAAGEAYVIEPGHDAEVLGDEAFVGFEFEPKAAEEYARG